MKTDLAACMEAVDQAIATLPPEQRTKPGFVLQVMNELLDAANAEYTAAIANGKVTEPTEYQDSRGFVIYADDLYQGISSQVSTENSAAHKAIESSLTELKTAWTRVIPPATAAKNT